MLALLTLLFALAFWAGSHVAWLLAIIIGFNLFFSPLVPLTDALANTGKSRSPWTMAGCGCGALLPL
nr:Probable 3-phenylpropionic acid transporter [Klebsiella pneumoniae]